MKRRIKRRAVAGLFAAAAGLASAKARAVEYMPLYNLSLLGGQYFFSGQKSNINGNANGNVTPAVKFNDNWSLMPTYNVTYQGTKQVSDPVGAGSLYQQVMDHRVSFMGIYAPTDSTWRIKPSAGFKWEFLKETRDEAWGNGLFDYQKTNFGFEAENVYKDPFSYRIGYDFYYIRFPHYQTLESQAGTDPNGNPLGRQDSGKNTLDTLNHQLSFSGAAPYPYNDPKVSLTGSYSVDWQTFPDQRIINAAGQPSDHKPYYRQDFIQSLSLGVAYPKAVTLWGSPYRLTHRFNMGAAYDGSNQNDFDANRTQFVPDAYSYYMWSLGPSWSLAWGDEKDPAWTSLGFTYYRTQYMGRLAQDGNGAYLSSHQASDTYGLALGYGCPIASHFSLKAQANFLWAGSNMAYQATYRYTYATANYLFGFVYDY